MKTTKLTAFAIIMSGYLSACGGDGSAAPVANNEAVAAPNLVVSPSPTPSATPSPSPSPSASPTPYAYSGGAGTIGSPYVLTVAEDVQHIADNPAAYFEMNQSINMNGFPFVPIANFSGVLYGNTWELDNLEIVTTGANDAALFLSLTGTVTQLKLPSVTITAGRFGAAVAITLGASALISGCELTGTITSPSGGNGNNTGIGVPYYKTEVTSGQVQGSTQNVYFNGDHVFAAPN